MNYFPPLAPSSVSPERDRTPGSSTRVFEKEERAYFSRTPSASRSVGSGGSISGGSREDLRYRERGSMDSEIDADGDLAMNHRSSSRASLDSQRGPRGSALPSPPPPRGGRPPPQPINPTPAHVHTYQHRSIEPVPATTYPPSRSIEIITVPVSSPTSSSPSTPGVAPGLPTPRSPQTYGHGPVRIHVIEANTHPPPPSSNSSSPSRSPGRDHHHGLYTPPASATPNFGDDRDGGAPEWARRR